jgi:hypothetical protein
MFLHPHIYGAGVEPGLLLLRQLIGIGLLYHACMKDDDDDDDDDDDQGLSGPRSRPTTTQEIR